MIEKLDTKDARGTYSTVNQHEIEKWEKRIHFFHCYCFNFSSICLRYRLKCYFDNLRLSFELSKVYDDDEDGKMNLELLGVEETTSETDH